MHDCGEDLLFDRELQLCNFADEVVCVDRNGALSVNSQLRPPTTKPPTPMPVAKETPFPTFGSIPAPTSGEVGEPENMLPKTASPTIQKTQSEMPPWLAFTIKDSNSGTRFVYINMGYFFFSSLHMLLLC